MQKMKWVLILVLGLSSTNVLAQVGEQRFDPRNAGSLDAQQEKRGPAGLIQTHRETTRVCR